MIAQEELKRILHYDPETGVFTRLVSPSPRWVGRKTKGTKTNGYLKINVGSREHMAHVIAWLYMTGDYLVNSVTHKNGKLDDNRWGNLVLRDYSFYAHHLSVRELREVLAYDAETGEFTWRKKVSDKTVVGARAGTKSNGYVHISVGKHMYSGHRLAWAFVHGEWAPNNFDIDHINGSRADNRIANLRIATRGQNLCNMPIRQDNTSGTKCVSWVKRSNKWLVKIGVDGRYVHVGHFEDKAEAVAAYRAAVVRLHGEFARLE